MGSYVFRWPYPANDVHVTGTFDDWGKTEQLNKVGDHWEKEVILPSADEKILYKFVVDDQWIVDDNAPKQDDGHWNINNVLLAKDIKRIEKEQDVTHDTPGAFPETPAVEPDSFSVQPIPASGGSSNPISLPAGEKLPPHEEITTNTIGSTVTTSKEDYDNAGSSDLPDFSAGQTKEAESYSVNPIPASSGVGNPIAVAPGAKLPEHSEVTANTIDSTVTTSKEDYENAGSSEYPDILFKHKEADSFGVNPIPASSGIGNPVSLAPGEKVPEHSEVTANTVDSTVTTSKEDYENAGSAGFPGAGIAAGAVAGAAAVGTAAASAFKQPEGKKNLIPESSLPMGGAATNTLDAGPFMSSSGPGTTTSELAAKVPLEKKRQAMVIDPEDVPATSVPEPVQASISQAHSGPEAASSTEAVKEKTDMEKELLSKTQRSEATGASAATASEQDSYYGLATTVPKPVEQSMEKAHAAPEAAADVSAVAEKSNMEKELLSKVPSAEGAGEPAPTIAAATSATAPSTTTAGTSSLSGIESPRLAGQAPFAAAAVSDGAAATPGLEGPKYTAPVETTEAANTEYAPVRAPGSAPGVSSSAAAALSDGCEDPTLVDEPAVKTAKESSHLPSFYSAATTEPTSTSTTGGTTGITVPTQTASTTVSDSASAAPVATGIPTTSVTPPAVVPATTSASHDAAKTTPAVTGIPTLSSAGTMSSDTTPTHTKAAAAAAPLGTSSPSTPGKNTSGNSAVSSPASSTATGEKKKHRHRISAFIKKVFD